MSSIPPFSSSGVLPPFLGGSPTVPAQVSPYRVAAVDFVERFATSKERVVVLNGFFLHRKSMQELGIRGFQWVNGSFTEDVETLERRSPNDIDCVTFLKRPLSCAGNIDAWRDLLMSNTKVFNAQLSKAAFLTDAYFVALEIGAEPLVKQTAYWFSLFSHKRITSLWKGLLELSLGDQAEDTAAIELLASKD